MTVSGGATATWTKLDHGVTGNPLGMATNLSFDGSGELDNGNTFKVNIAHDDQNAWSAAAITLDVAGIGSFVLDQGGGTGIDRLDDMMPSAKEESFDTGITTGIVTVTGAGNSTDIEWTVDSGFLPDGMKAYISYNPRADGTKASDKAGGGAVASTAKGSGYDVVIEHDALTDGLNVFAGYSKVNQEGAGTSQDHNAYVLGGTYAMGGITVGYQWSRDEHGAVGSTSYYENTAYAISYAVNDDLSISYGRHDSDRNGDLSEVDVEMENESFQVAYSMGGATIALAESSTDQSAYSTAASADKEATTVWLTLAF
jgi:outer membrane protein OmpU